ncbi:MAG: FkbM family methyltransferase [Crocinitomicaceae bacterium]
MKNILKQKDKESPVILDIGANIGLISLAILKEFPKAKIFAFEPGRHQYELFETTIEKNQLKENILLFDIALSNKNGTADFFVHSTEDASGDGLLDTGRAGKAKLVKIRTLKLDDWWKENGRIDVDLIKCDTEGAEYFVFGFGRELVTQCRPAIVLELFEKNIEKYPFTVKDLFDLFEELEYDFYTLSGEKLTNDNKTEMMSKMAEFQALPRK